MPAWGIGMKRLILAAQVLIEDAQDAFYEDPILYSAYAFFAAGAVSVASLAIAFCFHGLPL